MRSLSWLDVSEIVKRQIVNSKEPINEINKINRSRENRGQLLIDLTYILPVLKNETTFKVLKRSVLDKTNIDLQYLSTSVSLENIQTSRKEMSDFLFKEGMLDEGIMKKKREALAKRRKQKEIDVRQKSNEKDNKIKSRRQKVEFEEPSGYYIDLNKKKADRERVSNSAHPRKIKEKNNSISRIAKKNENALVTKSIQEARQLKRQRRLDRRFAAMNDVVLDRTTEIRTESDEQIEDDVFSFAAWEEALSQFKDNDSFFSKATMLSMTALCNFLYQLYRSRNLFDYMSAVTSYILSAFHDATQDFIDRMKKMFYDCRYSLSVFIGKCRCVTTESFSDGFSYVRLVIAKVMNSDVANAIRTLVLSAISMQWFNKDLSKKIISFIGRPPKMTVSEMLCSVLNGIDILIRVGEALVNGVPLSTVLTDRDPNGRFIDEVKLLMAKSDRLYRGLPSPGMFCMREFLHDCEILIKTGDELVKRVVSTDSRKREVKDSLFNLKDIFNTVLIRMNAHDRVEPIAVCISGAPGIGKSKLLRIPAHVWSSIKGRKFDVDQIYTRVTTSTFWEGYYSYSHPYVHYPEVGNISSIQAQRVGDPVIAELQKVIDSSPMPADMAFNRKGEVFVCPEMVLIDTNNKLMNVPQTMYCPAAIYRRFLYIDVVVKDEFCKKDSPALDCAKSLADNSNLLDRYIFTVSTYVDKGNNKGDFEIQARGDVYKLVSFLKDYFYKVLYEQSQVLREINYDFIYKDEFDLNVGLREDEEKLLDLTEEQKSDRWDSYGGWSDDIRTESMISSLSDVPLLSRVLSKSYDVFDGFVDVHKSVFSCAALEFLKMYLDVVHDYEKPFVFTYLRLFYILMFLYFNPCPWSFIYILIVLGWIINYGYFALFFFRVRVDKLRDIVAIKRKRALLRFAQVMSPTMSYNPFENPVCKKYAGIFSVITLGVAGYVGYKRFRSRRRFEGEDMWTEAVTESSVFRVDSHYNELLQVNEDLYGSGSHRVRIPVHESAQWNTMEGNFVATHHGSTAELYPSIASHVRRVKVVTTSEITTHVLGICSTYALINTHSFAGNSSGVILYSPSTSYDLGHVIKEIPFGPTDFVHLGNDVSIINLKKLQFRNIVKHIIDADKPPKMFKGIFKNEECRFSYFDTPLQIGDRNSEVILSRYLSYANINHSIGDCGNVIVAEVDSGCSGVVGFHSAGSRFDDGCFASFFNKKMILDGVSKLERMGVVLPVNSLGVIPESLIEPSSKSPFRYEYLPNLVYHGKFDMQVMLKKKSMLTSSKFRPYLKDLFLKHFDFKPVDRFTAPLMRPRIKDGEYQYPFNLGLRKMNNDPPLLDVKILNRVIREYVDRIVSMLRDRNITSINPLTVEEAINGVKDDCFIRRVNASTSGGFGFPGGKSSHIPIVAQEEGFVFREPTSDLKKRLLEIEECYKNLDCSSAIFSAQLKDEPRAVKKVAMGDTRIFYMSPVDNLIMSRRFLASFYSLMVECDDVFCTAVGINMHTGSDKLVRELAEFSPYILEGDYSKFDIATPLCIIRAANTVVYKVCEALGYNKDALLMVRGVLSDNTFPLIEMNGDLFMKPGLQPSGKYATAEDNCLHNNIMLMYAWYSVPVLQDTKFFECVKPVTYGDDLLAAVKAAFASHFNNVVYQFLCKYLFDMDYTSASKSNVLEPFVRVDEMSFLKRHFVFKENKGVWEGLLSLDSIYKSLEWYLPSKAVTEEMQMVATCMSALWECYFHMDAEEPFMSLRNDLAKILSESFGGSCHEYLKLLPSFKEVHLRIYPEVIDA